MYSVLQNKKKIKFQFDKFPYLIIDDALPTDLYNKLNATFPRYEKIIGENEYNNDFYTLKKLDTGNQIKIKINELNKYLND